MLGRTVWEAATGPDRLAAAAPLVERVARDDPRFAEHFAARFVECYGSGFEARYLDALEPAHRDALRRHVAPETAAARATGG